MIYKTKPSSRVWLLREVYLRAEDFIRDVLRDVQLLLPCFMELAFGYVRDLIAVLINGHYEH